MSIWQANLREFKTTIGGRQFLIPDTYRPRKEGQALVIDAMSPNFTPYDPAKHRYQQQSYDIKIFDASSVDLPEILDRRIASSPFSEVLESQFNLKKVQLYRENSIRKFPTGLIFTGYDEAGRLTELIDCYALGTNTPPPMKPDCRYLSVGENRLGIDLSIEDPSQWLGIKQTVMKLIASFERRS